MNVTGGYRIAKQLQRLGALGAEADRVLVVRTIINALPAHERAELARLVERFADADVLTPKQCSTSERRLIRAVIAAAGERPRVSQVELEARAASLRRRMQSRAG